MFESEQLSHTLLQINPNDFYTIIRSRFHLFAYCS